MRIQNRIKVCKTPSCNRHVVYRNGIPTSKWCPNCTLKRNYKKSSPERAHKKTLKSPQIRTSMQKAIAVADMWHSRYVRLIGATVYGDMAIGECYTCGSFNNIKKMDCGHYIGRGHHTVRWEVNNARPQCTKCNCYQGGKHFEFEQRLLKEIGSAAVQELKDKANEIADYSVAEVRDIAKTYRISVRLKEQELGLKVWD